jgi:energy-coupling factor transport system permease protein
MKQLPTGQFIPGTSILHGLDARAKILCLIILLVAIVSASSPWGFVLALAMTALTVALTMLPLRVVINSVQRMWLFFFVIFLMNALFFDDTVPIWSWWIFRISETGIRQGISVVVHVALIIILGNVLTLTTAPMDVTMALESLIKPLKLMGVPTEEVAMIISVAIQFIPTLMEEADMIRMAQTARGAQFESKKVAEKVTSFISLVVPIFISAFRRADELSLAMEARGYRNARNRTKRKREPFLWRDYAALTLCVGVLMSQLTLFR